MTILFDIIAIALYLSVAAYQGCYLLDFTKQPPRRILISLSILAIVFHGLSLFSNVIDLGFYKIASLIFWFIALLGVIGALRRPIENLLVISFPLASIAIIVSIFSSNNHELTTQMNAGMLTHIISSLLAYSALTIATMQALTLSLQDYQLKHHHLKGLLRHLPPLQTMEAMLFESLWIGVGLLSLSIVSGIIFIDDIFAQHLIHKSALTIAAWLIFSILLWGHWKMGWRSQTAVKWTIGGFIALMLGYFGSKFVLELILNT